ncbi:hypothetical protein CK203_023771 [Vitis vinifera]|uniref:Uncharacterized protein n=1 Tax=Vitis vinifera TaxID=29760 RepID=A0A438J9W5_VITVI|nr:hypothetical protein CK203_023771 [Vitis vinifera]
MVQIVDIEQGSRDLGSCPALSGLVLMERKRWEWEQTGSLGVDPFKTGCHFFDLLVDPWQTKRMMTLVIEFDARGVAAYLLFLERWIFEVVSEEMGAFSPILLVKSFEDGFLWMFLCYGQIYGYVSSGWSYCLSGCQDRHLFSGWSASFFFWVVELGEGDDHSSFKTNGLNWMDLGLSNKLASCSRFVLAKKLKALIEEVGTKSLIAQQCWMRRVGDRSQVQGLKEEG